ncbi:hypothetical protein [Yoonia vestfoldensis]|uniref:hypothetical protein n=1 Tax=Yoonia vestfoldensis TaxID=245188 RepID=UPI000379FE91|nr:hypothetical protein [Yoonia vestfoldensis]
MQTPFQRLAAFAIATAGSSAFAQDLCGPLVASYENDGLRFTSIAADQTREILGAELTASRPSDTAILVAIPGFNLSWYESSAEAISALVGSDGNWIYNGPAACDPDMQDPITFTEDEGLIVAPPPDDLVFTPEEGLEIDPDGAVLTPRDGLWKATVGPTRMEGCPAMMAQAFPVSPGALPGMEGDTRRMSFSRPFDPNALEMTQSLRSAWVEVGPNTWITEAMPGAFAQIPQGQSGGSRLLMELTVASPDLILFDRTIEIILPDVATAMMGISPDGCRVRGNERWERIGD